ncbi:hypothetical protein [Nitrososphaera viennensis]|uniref:Uncharacterized protein n=2 Tax=Nitrososphaera viennensis TaxID=1034015 RepID=A0A060HG03_9ARCH|nr:hypothetical protein [Nitrososphaera viennensis]AIC15544.1 exported protein of unknown function [Nitrososphaera viennensis EN76]UVS70429.1 hypothetical protein NWT39_06490 [Nitrososphaera viennensis]
MLQHTLALAFIFVVISVIPLIPSAFATSYELMTPSIPKAITIDNLPAREGMVGQQLMITTTVQSNLNEARPYAAIIEIRDSDGVTIALSYQEGNMDAHGLTPMGMSWIPQKAGTYQFRTFVVSGIQNAQAYSPVASSEIKISER